MKSVSTYCDVAASHALFCCVLSCLRSQGFSPGAEKNIRRRVYDALNVLFSAGVIQKEKKHIMWRGLPEQLEVQSLEVRPKIDIRRTLRTKSPLCPAPCTPMQCCRGGRYRVQRPF